MYIRYCHCFCAAMSPSTFATILWMSFLPKWEQTIVLLWQKKSWLEWSLSPCPAVPAFAKTDPSSDLIQVCLALSGHENDIKWEQIKTQCIINRLSSFQRAFEFGYTPMILKAVWLFALSSGLEGFITLQKKYVRKDCTLLQLCFVCFVDRIFSSLSWFTAALKLPY